MLLLGIDVGFITKVEGKASQDSQWGNVTVFII